eukprot:6451776-Amphidinium_carterae.1
MAHIVIRGGIALIANTNIVMAQTFVPVKEIGELLKPYYPCRRRVQTRINLILPSKAAAIYYCWSLFKRNCDKQALKASCLALPLHPHTCLSPLRTKHLHPQCLVEPPWLPS